MNKKISTPIALGIILTITFIMGGVIYWRLINITPNFTEIGLLYNNSNSENSKETNNEPINTIDYSNKQFLYYYNESSNPNTLNLYQLYLDPSLNDKKIKSLIGNFNIHGKFIEAKEFIISEDNKLYVLDASSGETNEILSLNKEKSFINAILSHDKNYIAYTVSSSSIESGEEQEIWIYNLDKKENKKIFEKNIGFYSNLRVLGWNRKDDKIIIKEGGCEGGGCWGGIYLLDIKENNYKKLEIPFDGKLSPDGENWIYTSCAELNYEIADYYSCKSGEEIIAYNFNSLESRVIYKNLTHSNNSSRDKLRIVNSAIWQDEENIIFFIPDGIYQLNINSKNPKELYKFSWVDPDEIFKLPSRIIFADDQLVIFARWGAYGGKFILNLNTKKIIDLGEYMFDIQGFLE